MALVDYYLKIEGISGESTDAKHKGEIELESFSWGVSQPALSSLGGGAGAGKVQFQDLHFTMLLNRASPNLFLRCASGEHIKEAILTASATDQQGEANDFLKVTFSDVLVSSYQDGGVTGGNTVQGSDSVSLHYAKAQESTGQPASVDVPPRLAASMAFDPSNKEGFTIVEGSTDMQKVGVSNGVIQRAISEYDVSEALGLLTAPFGGTTLILETTELRSPTEGGGPPVDTTGGPHGRHAPAKFAIFLYQPADFALTSEDFTREGEHVGSITVDPLAAPQTVMTNLGRRLRHDGDGTFGIRLELQALDDWETPVTIRGAEPHLDVMATFRMRVVLNSG